MSGPIWSQDPATLRALAAEHDESRHFFEKAVYRASTPDHKRDFEVRVEVHKNLAQRLRHRAGRIEKKAAGHRVDNPSESR